ncbi:MAG: hypothetical protein E6Q97_17820 [Desulfurellales bacterium]|nr:MAG: hypothetical protein E6Q97_17820 [Desulfurellales bacterium]
MASYPLPKNHWLYAPREYEPGAEEPNELPHPILTHAHRAEVVAAIRYAIRGATMCGKEKDFDPDALVQNAVYALCGPFTKPLTFDDVEPMTEALIDQIESAARASFRRHQSSIKGQILTAADNYDWHLLHAAYQAGIHALRAALASAAQPPASLPTVEQVEASDAAKGEPS